MMTKPKVILHSSISLDGSILGFDVDMEKHYQIVGSYKADIHLIGSNTIKAGIKMFCPQIPKEEKRDFVKPNRSKSLPLWIIPDTRGKLEGLHHIYRRFELCRDIVVLVSKRTPQKYLKYLKDRSYDYHVVGEINIDLKRALDLMVKRYKAKRVLTDTGRILNCILLNNGLVDEVSLLVHPVIVGKQRYDLLGQVKENLNLELIRNEVFRDNKVWLRYKVKKGSRSFRPAS